MKAKLQSPKSAPSFFAVDSYEFTALPETITIKEVAPLAELATKAGSTPAEEAAWKAANEQAYEYVRDNTPLSHTHTHAH